MLLKEIEYDYNVGKFYYTQLIVPRPIQNNQKNMTVI